MNNLTKLNKNSNNNQIITKIKIISKTLIKKIQKN